MADLGRKDYTEQASNSNLWTCFHTIKRLISFYEQAKDAITPDSQKSTLDKTKDTVTGKADDVARALQPEGQKSTTQKMGDSTKDTFDQGTEQVSLRLVILYLVIKATHQNQTGSISPW